MAVGVETFSGLLNPSSPYSLDPHMKMSPAYVRKAVCIAPQEICAKELIMLKGKQTFIGALNDLYYPVPNAPYYPNPHE